MTDIQHVTDADFENEVLRSDTPVLVDFWAPGCGLCLEVAPVLAAIAADHPDLRVVRLNVDENPMTAARYGITGMPTMTLYRGGEVIGTIREVNPRHSLETDLRHLLDGALVKDGPVLELPPRVVTLVLCTSTGEVLGSLPPFEVTFPFWPDAAGVVSGAREAWGMEITVLRVLGGESGRPGPGGAVTYVAEVAAPPALPLGPAPARVLDPCPLRQRWAGPGGPAADLRWADEHLKRVRTPRSGPAEQVRSWNLSSVWRLPTEGGAAWLKAVPPFFAHEGPVLELLAASHPGAAPAPLAAEPGRVLLPEVPGPDLYEAAGPLLLQMVDLLVDLQVAYADRLAVLLGTGAPDWRPEPLRSAAEDVIRRTSSQLDGATLGRLDALLDGWDARTRDLEAAGVPESLVHGDFHPGNLRGGSGALVLLDWGDCGVGNPLLDTAAFLDRIPREDRPVVARHWEQAWRQAVPGSDPERARKLLGPRAAVRQAVVYRRFLDGIEPDERVYHRGDPSRWLRRAAELADPV